MRGIFFLRHSLFTNNLHQDALGSSAVEFSVEDLFPGTEVEFSPGNRDNHLAPHDLPFKVSVGVVFTHIMPVAGNGLVGGELFQPLGIIGVKPGFIIVYEYRCGYVHGIAQQEAFPDSALDQALLDLRRDVRKCHPGGDVEPQFLAIAFHNFGYVDMRKVSTFFGNNTPLEKEGYRFPPLISIPILNAWPTGSPSLK